jgi:hypothetical protein
LVTELKRSKEEMEIFLKWSFWCCEAKHTAVTITYNFQIVSYRLWYSSFKLKLQVLWVVVPCVLVNGDVCGECGTSLCGIQHSKMSLFLGLLDTEGGLTALFRTVADLFCQSTQHNISEGLNLQQHRCENLKSPKLWVLVGCVCLRQLPVFCRMDCSVDKNLPVK